MKSLPHSKKSSSKSAPPTPDALLNSISSLSLTSPYDSSTNDDTIKSMNTNTSKSSKFNNTTQNLKLNFYYLFSSLNQYMYKILIYVFKEIL